MQNPKPNPSKNSTPTNNKSPQDPPSDDESPKETNPTTLQSSLRAPENGKLAADGEGGSDGQAMKGRKSNIHCHRCKHVFPTWAALMKHYQEHYICCHPNGYSAPPGFSPFPSTSTATPPQPDQHEGDDQSQPIEIEDSDTMSSQEEGRNQGANSNTGPEEGRPKRMIRKPSRYN